MKKTTIVLMLITLLAAGCSSLPVQIPGLSQSTPTVGATPVIATAQPTQPTQSTQPPQPEFTATPTMPVQPKIDAEKTISLFLDGQKAGATYALTSNLMSAAYAAKVKDDTGLIALLGTPESIGSYKIGSPSYSADLSKATLEGTIYLPEPSNARFSLIIENSEWKIDDVTLLSSTGDYPTTPEAVVLSFLTSYQEAPDRMSNFLIPSRRAQQPPGGAAGMLQINGSLEGMVVQSAAVNPDPPSASIHVVIRAGGKDYVRRFLLTKDASLWGIDAIEATSE